jgi:hypothetical protein
MPQGEIIRHLLTKDTYNSLLSYKMLFNNKLYIF